MDILQALNDSGWATIEVNQRGIEKLRFIVEEYGNFEWRGDSEQINALAFNDIGFNDDGFVMLELSSFKTKNKQPFTYELSIYDDFDVEIIS